MVNQLIIIPSYLFCFPCTGAGWPLKTARGKSIPNRKADGLPLFLTRIFGSFFSMKKEQDAYWKNSFSLNITIVSLPFFIIIFFLPLLPLLGNAQDTLPTKVEKETNSLEQAENTPKNLHLSHIEINKQFINFKRLNDSEYRQKVAYGEALSQSFDSLVPFYHYPTTLNLPHYLNDLTFHFAAIEWKNPHRILYSYYLEGFEKDWNVPSKKAEAIYQNLPHGTYTLKIKTKGDEPIWSEPFSYTFSIRRPWWLSWWAYAGYFLMLAGLAYYAFRFYEKRKLESLQLEQLLMENKLLAFSKKAQNRPAAKENSFLDLVNQTLETHLSDENFGIAELCEILNISRAQLHRKLKKLTGLSTSHYIRSLRLDIAKGLLEKTQLNVSEVAFNVGFSSATYFSKVFKEEFGYAPKEIR